MQEYSKQTVAMDPETLRRAFSEKPSHRVKRFTAATCASDCASAITVAITAAIPISIIDYSIMSRVAGVTDSSLKELLKGVRTVLFRPHKFFLPCKENKCCVVFYACATTYGFTYIASNLTKSYCESHGVSEKANFAAGISSGIVNTLLTIWKDSVILRQLPRKNSTGSLADAKRIPHLTKLLFCSRDVLTCVAAFTMAPMMANWLARYCYHHKRIAGIPSDTKLPEDEGKLHLPLSIPNTAQIITPALLQFLTTLLHITAIGYRQTYPKFDWFYLLERLKTTYLSSTMLRMCRIVPAFGIGGILNYKVRMNLLDKVDLD